MPTVTENRSTESKKNQDAASRSWEFKCFLMYFLVIFDLYTLKQKFTLFFVQAATRYLQNGVHNQTIFYLFLSNICIVGNE